MLVVEDDDATRELLASLLEDRGHLVTAASDTGSALAALEQRIFPLVILDWQLAREDGSRICAAIRSDPTRRDAVIVVVTASPTREPRNAIVSAGVDDIVAKPFELDYFDLRLAIAERQAAALFAADAPGALAALHERLLIVSALGQRLSGELAVTHTHAAILAAEPRLPDPMRPLVIAVVDGITAAEATLDDLRAAIRPPSPVSVSGPARETRDLAPCPGPRSADS